MTTQFMPEPGMGVTYNINGDSYPYTIASVSPSGAYFMATRDRFVAAKKGNTHANPEKRGVFVTVQDAEHEKFTRRRDGSYMPKGAPYASVTPGRSKRTDPHF